MEALKVWITSQNTDLEVGAAVTAGIEAWQAGTICSQTFSPNVQRVFQEQTRIGWNNLMVGLLASGWSKLQQSHYDSIITYRTGDTWARALVRRIWQIAWDLWVARNKAVTQIRSAKKVEIDTAMANIKVQALYERGVLQLPEARREEYARFFSPTLRYLLRQSLEFKRSWIASIDLVCQEDDSGEEVDTSDE